MTKRTASRSPTVSASVGPDLVADLGRLRRRVQLMLTASILLANVIGAAVVSLLALVVIPGAPLFTAALAPVNFVVLPLYVAAALVVGVVAGTRRSVGSLLWVTAERPPTEQDRRRAMDVPWRLAQLQALLWAVATLLFTLLYGLADPSNIPRTFFTVLFGGVIVCANSYLLSEYALRPVAAMVLAAGGARSRLTGVGGRALLAWTLGSGLPVLGLILVATFSLLRRDVSTDRLAVTVLTLAGITLAVGLLLTVLGVRGTVAPIQSVREGLAAVNAGDLSARVVVFDGTELGDLQIGFNTMAAGLQERERLRDLFGWHVGEDVATAALERPPELGGEERNVAVFFIDMIGSTAFATRETPTTVVELLNSLFTVVIDEVERYGGFVNKFAGDGALAVFGAPAHLSDPAGSALAAARRIHARLAVEVPSIATGTGVSSGRAVAGNVGDRRRFEYTVIGDPVNEAARLAELAKSVDGGLLAAGACVAAAGAEEAARWQPCGRTVLRGRSEPTTLAVPVHH
ncbi:MAG: adenylate/guanylate cyclase domain-containing protein [Mycobacteriales bacterium]